MYYYEVFEIGRQSVKSVNASILATLIKELVNEYEKKHGSKAQHRKYYVKCKEKLEFTPKKNKKNGDDEGFVSDANEEDSLFGDPSGEDARSATCCLVDDHVFRGGKSDVGPQHSYDRDPASLVSIIGSVDSANSSGSSDTDELDTLSSAPSPVSQFKRQAKSVRGDYASDVEEKNRGKNKKEEYPIADVIFCHTEPKYPTVVAWVIKKQRRDADCGSRLGTTGVETFSRTDNCLEVIVVKCKNGDSLKDLCSDYREYSKRIKLDQYKTIKRKRDDKHASATVSQSICASDVKVSLSDMKIANSGLIKASELSILNPKIMMSFKNDLKNSVSLNSLNRPDHGIQDTAASRDPRTSESLPSHVSVKKTQSLTNLSKTWDVKTDAPNQKGNLQRDKSSASGDRFSLIQRTDLNGITHLEVSTAKFGKSVLTENFSANKTKLRKEIEGVIMIDVESYAKKEQIRQMRGSENGEPQDKACADTPPVRPERKKYLKKKSAAPSLDDAREDGKPKTATSFFLSLPPNENQAEDQKVLRGPYVRVQSWGSQNARDSIPNGWRAEPKGRHASKHEEKYSDRRRSKSAGRAPKKTPMAYRYVDVAGDCRGVLSGKGVPQKARDFGGGLADTVHNSRRRKSFDDLIAIDGFKGNLKSVIKKNKKINDKYGEPKKVTFSAFATVQVVD